MIKCCLMLLQNNTNNNEKKKIYWLSNLEGTGDDQKREANILDEKKEKVDNIFII